ncbi:hypothetical protein H4Q26_001770 [Puccinia striiformis f. sp. tritici PST-130]|nr:hypothetical protein H4Q26_001770 [Puccinia striiformis f. sp. tritici PST-130]
MDVCSTVYRKGVACPSAAIDDPSSHDDEQLMAIWLQTSPQPAELFMRLITGAAVLMAVCRTATAYTYGCTTAQPFGFCGFLENNGANWYCESQLSTPVYRGFLAIN